ncbi:hypothetical protein [Methylovirgula sp. HY1]|uniref:hypothetical protein n=1 Tax=Methylovirgula sp. HY1 TaxID=2822761 RepID=UPI001C5BB891|nr:hypothetical protein [Methylovirgula sp. HY1]
MSPILFPTIHYGNSSVIFGECLAGASLVLRLRRLIRHDTDDQLRANRLAAAFFASVNFLSDRLGWHAKTGVKSRDSGSARRRMTAIQDDFGLNGK